MTDEIDPNGNTPIHNVYDVSSRVIQQKDGCGNTYTFNYDPTNRQTTMTDALVTPPLQLLTKITGQPVLPTRKT